MGVITDVTPVPPTVYQRTTKPNSNGKELSRLITAAVVNQEFCNMLLSNPDKALASGYNGESFFLGAQDQDLVLSIKAKSLAEFAMHLANHQNGKGKHNGNGKNRGL
jgi:hypothetical protein